MTVTLPPNARGPILDLTLPASVEALSIILRNRTTGKRLVINLPAAWSGDDLSLDFYRRTITDQTGADRSALLDSTDNALWTPEPLIAGVNDVEVEARLGNPATIVTDTLGNNYGGIAINATHLFWVNIGAGRIGRAKISGTEQLPEFLTFPTAPTAVAVDANFIYWTDFSVTPGSGFVGRAAINGTGGASLFDPTEAFQQMMSKPVLAVDATFIYFGWQDSETNYIGRAKLNGTEVTKKHITSPIMGVSGLAVDATFIYWHAAGNIYRAKLNGTEIVKIASGVSEAEGLAVDATYIYWASRLHGIGRARLDGSEAEEEFIPPFYAGLVGGVAVNATHAFFVEGGAGIGGHVARTLIYTAYTAKAALRWERAYY